MVSTNGRSRGKLGNRTALKWARENPNGETIESCTILTTPSNELVANIHDRMPVIVPPDKYDL
jgi:putative SOS response-associated peptidase YedK